MAHFSVLGLFAFAEIRRQVALKRTVVVLGERRLLDFMSVVEPTT